MERDTSGAPASIGFDRAVEYYDRTRALTPEAMAAVVALLRDALLNRGPTLEIGVGTGRIGLPLGHAGIEMTGVDLSEPMLRRLVEKSGGSAPWPLAAADARRLPFRDGSFGSALAVHVLHLIEDWRRAVEEVARVTRSGGLFLMPHGQARGSIWEEVTSRFRTEAGLPAGSPGVSDPVEVDAAVRHLGGDVGELPVIVERRTYAPGQIISMLEEGLFSFTWRADPDTRTRAAARVRRWAMERYGRLDAPVDNEFAMWWRAYTLP